jgi:hypothetical protein
MITTTYGGEPQVAYSPAPKPFVSTGVERAVMTKEIERDWGQVIRAIQELSYLRDDWDGEGSDAPSLALVQRAIQVAQFLRDLRSPIPTTAVATRSGAVLFAWEDGLAHQEIEVVTPNQIEWMVIEHSNVAKHGEITLPPQEAGGGNVRR